MRIRMNETQKILFFLLSFLFFFGSSIPWRSFSCHHPINYSTVDDECSRGLVSSVRHSINLWLVPQVKEVSRLIILKSIMFCPLSPFLFRDLSFGIRKLHQIHFVFLLIVLGYQSLFLFSSFSFSLDLISIAGKEFTSHRI